MIDERFLEGLKLFNEGEFFECHEVIEELWLETDSGDPNRDLYKGVIQAAAALYQFERGILSGAIGLYGTSTAYLEKYSPEALGLNVRKLIDEMHVCFEVLNRWDGKKAVLVPKERIPKLQYQKPS